MIGKVDAVYFTKDWRSSRGCRIERQVAKEYGVKILDYDFLEPEESSIKRLTWNTSSKPLTSKEIDDIEEAAKKNLENMTLSDTTNKIEVPGIFYTNIPQCERKSGPIDILDPLSRWYEDED